MDMSRSDSIDSLDKAKGTKSSNTSTTTSSLPQIRSGGSSSSASSSSTSSSSRDQNPNWKEGYLMRRMKGIIRNTWKEKFVILLEGSFFFYQTPTDLTPRGVIHLSKCKVSKGDEKKLKRKNVICISAPNEDYYFSTEHQHEKIAWFEAIIQAQSKSPSPPPDKEYIQKSKPSTLYMSNRLIDKISNVAGGKIVKEFVNADNEILMDCLKSFLNKYLGLDKVSKFEKESIALGIKIAMLYKEKYISKEYFQSTIVPIRIMISKMIDGYEIPFSFSPADLIESIREVQQCLDKILRPFMHDKILNKMGMIFDFLCNEDMIGDLFEKKKYKECEILGTTLRRMWDSGLF